jgi:hypothetical protein
MQLLAAAVFVCRACAWQLLEAAAFGALPCTHQQQSIHSKHPATRSWELGATSICMAVASLHVVAIVIATYYSYTALS